jgi:alkylation response protein AidB-like acyl-CoA dehydrogenase
MELTEERQALREAVRSLLTGYPTRAAIDAPAGFDAGLWARLCKEIGVAGLAVPEQYGGAGATLLETHVVLEELGRTLTPGPMLGCAVLATQALLLSDDEDARSRLLPAICGGERIVTVAWDDVTVTGDGHLTGSARQILDLDAADTLLIADGTALFEVDCGAPGLTRRPASPLDPTRRLGAVDLDRTPARRLAGNPLPALRDVACVALTADQVGAATRAFELTVDYTKTREQFGRPIGSFQALQHRLADTYVRLESARSASWAAADALAAASPEAPALAAAAKVYCTEALQAVTAEMVQMHGGIAITWEHDAHLYLRRAHASAHLFGAPGAHVTRLAATVLGD